MAWDPEQYLTFRDLRLRPALELLARVEQADPAVVVDLGCGPGDVTARLRTRWPGAALMAVDGSSEMLRRAQASHGGLGVDWIEADLRDWEPPRPVEVLYSNAALHWLDDHDALFPRLVSWLAPGGVLAVQMPRNHAEPSHTVAFHLAGEQRWRDRLGPLVRPQPVAPPERYHDLLAPHVSSLDIWETVYLQVVATADEVVEWTKGSLLRPMLAALGPSDAEEFETRYRERIRSAYPPGPGGEVLFPFRRQFIVARR